MLQTVQIQYQIKRNTHKDTGEGAWYLSRGQGRGHSRSEFSLGFLGLCFASRLKAAVATSYQESFKHMHLPCGSQFPSKHQASLGNNSHSCPPSPFSRYSKLTAIGAAGKSISHGPGCVFHPKHPKAITTWVHTHMHTLTHRMCPFYTLGPWLFLNGRSGCYIGS